MLNSFCYHNLIKSQQKIFCCFLFTLKPIFRQFIYNKSHKFFRSFIKRFGINTNSVITYIFYIDTNGAKQPNIIGKDIFLFGFKEETGNLVTAGADKTMEEVRKNCTTSQTGYWCSTLVKNSGWKIPEIK